MTPIDEDEPVSVPLSEFVRNIAREAARIVIDEHVRTCPFAGELQMVQDIVKPHSGESISTRVTRLEEARAVSKTFILGMVSVAGAVGSLSAVVLKLLGI
jgi:hypothetical protein